MLIGLGWLLLCEIVMGKWWLHMLILVAIPLSVDVAELWAIKEGIMLVAEMDNFPFSIHLVYLGVVNLVNSKSPSFSILGTIADEYSIRYGYFWMLGL